MQTNFDEKRTWAVVDLSAIKHNYHVIKDSLPKNCAMLGVLKADAYGHGALRVAEVLQKEGAGYLAVACLDEAILLRESGISLPILVLGHTPKEYTSTLVSYDLTQTVTCLSKAVEYSEEASRFSQILKVHIKVDTGMGRLGFLCEGEYFNEGVDNIFSACRLQNLFVEGIYTHFSMADDISDQAVNYTRKQYMLFQDVIDVLKKRGVTFKLHHCANSGAVSNFSNFCMDMVRPGILLYGYGGDNPNLIPAMRLVTKISTIKIYNEGTPISYGGSYVTQKKTRVAVLGIGYADGLLRSLSAKCSFIVCGKSAKQIGKICMDMCMIDISDIPEATVDTEVEIFGCANSLEFLSKAAGTIPYELLCSVSKRVPRVYVD